MTGFSIEALEAGIESAKKNIKIFEEAAEKERDIIKEYYMMIETIEKKKRESNMVIEIEAE